MIWVKRLIKWFLLSIPICFLILFLPLVLFMFIGAWAFGADIFRTFWNAVVFLFVTDF